MSKLSEGPTLDSDATRSLGCGFERCGDEGLRETCVVGEI